MSDDLIERVAQAIYFASKRKEIAFDVPWENEPEHIKRWLRTQSRAAIEVMQQWHKEQIKVEMAKLG